MQHSRPDVMLHNNTRTLRNWHSTDTDTEMVYNSIMKKFMKLQ